MEYAKSKYEKKPAAESTYEDPTVRTILVGGNESGLNGANSRYWLYVGQYVTFTVEDLTTDEWNLQDPKVKDTPSLPHYRLRLALDRYIVRGPASS